MVLKSLENIFVVILLKIWAKICFQNIYKLKFEILPQAFGVSQTPAVIIMMPVIVFKYEPAEDTDDDHKEEDKGLFDFQVLFVVDWVKTLARIFLITHCENKR